MTWLLDNPDESLEYILADKSGSQTPEGPDGASNISLLIQPSRLIGIGHGKSWCTDFLNKLCSKHGIACYDSMSLFTGKNCCLNSSTVDLFLKYELQPTSTKNMVHLTQTVRKGDLTKFDYGSPIANMVHYSQLQPPLYNMSNIPSNMRLFLSYGGQDALSDVKDIQLLLDNLKFHDADKLTVQFEKDFAHADFIMGVNAKIIVYNPIIAFFNSQ
ncbi:hypothetical protein AAC387_Pa09g1746 [Persea americana]